MKKTKDRGVFTKVPELERPLTKKELKEIDDIDDYVVSRFKQPGTITPQGFFPERRMTKGARIRALETKTERLEIKIRTLSRIVREMVEREERKKRR
jgi:hypothetical protein